MNYNIYCGGLNDLLKKDRQKIIINTINPHSYVEAKKDRFFSDALHYSDYLLPDGIGVVWAVSVLMNKKIRRVTGADLHLNLIESLSDYSGKCFYLGSSQKTLELIRKKNAEMYPNINTQIYSPPYAAEFTEKEDNIMLKAINDFEPDVLFVGMTAPKQEKWVYKNKDKINAKIVCSIGAVFDFYAGTVKRPNETFQKLGLEWLPRLIHEPKRLWKRMFVSAPIFVFHVFRKKLGF